MKCIPANIAPMRHATEATGPVGDALIMTAIGLLIGEALLRMWSRP
jgi:multisubunit Na+/H+ antiporter MnhC subunit